MRSRAHASNKRSCRALPLLAVVAAFAWVIVPFKASAEITVEPPTGSAEPALLKELHTSVGMVVSGAATAYQVDGDMRMTVDASGDNVTIVLELAPNDGTAPIRESRTVARTRAATEVRAVARAMIRAVAERRSGTAAQESEGSKESPQPERVWPVLDSPYSRKRAFWISAGPTFGGVVFGGAMIGLAFATKDETARVAMLGIGWSIAGLAFIVGPGLGHFYVKNIKQAAWDLALRAVLSGGAFGLFACGAWFGPDFIVGGAIAAAAALTFAVVDLATVRRAAQRANEKALEKKEAGEKISGVAFAPMFAPGPNGSTTAGLAFSMQF